jgi:hypothetical protein
VEPFRKVTVPVGTEPAPFTVAVNPKTWPVAIIFEEDARLVVEA